MNRTIEEVFFNQSEPLSLKEAPEIWCLFVIVEVSIKTLVTLTIFFLLFIGFFFIHYNSFYLYGKSE